MISAPEFQRWFNQAVHTCNSAKRDYKDADFGWACFKCQQAAECVLKALLRGAGKLGINSLLKLTQEIEALNIDVDEIRKCSLTLEKFYIPTRYPDACPEGSPYEYYDADRISPFIYAVISTIMNTVCFEELTCTDMFNLFTSNNTRGNNYKVQFVLVEDRNVLF